MDKERLHKYALNQLSDKKEIEEVLNWINSTKENQEEYNTLKNLWAISGFANYDTYNKIDKAESKKVLHPKFNPYRILKYAAVFVLAFLIGGSTFFYFFSNSELTYNEIIVPAGESAEVILPDQSHVWLNSGSKMVYPTSFDNKSRDIQLSGEAYFEVTHNPKKVFHVKTSNLTVEVLGTSFNVEAYNQSDDINVTLIEGKVRLRNNDGKVLTDLVPHENALFNLKENKISITNVEIDYYTSWKNGYLLFDDAKLDIILSKIERWYNVQVVYEDDSMKDIKFTGTILKNKPIDQILDVLKYTSNFNYTIEMKDNVPSIIYLKNRRL